MKRHALALAITLACCAALPVAAGSLDPAVQAAVAAAGLQQDVPVIIRFKKTVDLKALRREARQLARVTHPGDARAERKARRKLKRRMLVVALKDAARQSKREVKQLLKSHGENRKLKLLWARNSVAGSLPADLLDAVAALPGVGSVSLDIVVQGPGDGTAPSAPSDWNLPATGVGPVWDTGNTGQDVVVATLDTGVDAAHPDLGPRWRGGTNSWFDPHGQHATPGDVNGHGTQVMGLIVGGSALGYQLGMAPGAQWIAAKIFDNSNESTLSAIHEAYQWVLDPDDNALTDDAPDIVNNSWALQGTVNACNQEFAADIALLKEAEIAVVFSAGNYGPNLDTSVSPANDPAVVSVGSVDSGLNIDIQSSRGAGACDGGIYPRLVAPGENVMTADRVPLYYNWVSGTSFAVAHLSGAMAVLKSAFPEATLGELESSLIETVSDLGPGGPDDDFGQGMLNVTAAYDWLEAALGGGAPEPGALAFGAATYSIDENAASLSATVTRIGGSAGEVSVDYVSTDVTAIAGQDYQGSAGTLVFADGETSRSIGVALLDDAEDEADETFSLSLGNAQGGATLGSQQESVVTILDDDPPAGPADSDADGYTVDLDCNDNDATVNPGASEISHDGIDQDCNGYDLTIDVTRARFVSRQNKLVVWATSDLAAQAGLRMQVTLSNGATVNRNLTWKANKGRWQKTIKNLAATPVAVTVSGIEGAKNSAVEQR